MGFGTTYFGALVFGAGLVVSSMTPAPPSTGGNGYGTAQFGQHVFGAGVVVTSETPVPPATTGGNGPGTVYHGAHVFGAGFVVTSMTPVGPEPESLSITHFYGGDMVRNRPVVSKWNVGARTRRQMQQVEAIIAAFLALRNKP